jgi:hypothetical protein
MDVLLLIPAALGFMAIGLRVLRAGAGVLGRGMQRFVAGEVADVRARRGDLTGLSAARQQRAHAVRAQLRAAGVLSFWVALLIVPVLTPWPRWLYAAYSLLWLVPRVQRPPRSS